MEKVNIKFHDNYTVTYQHKKILQFVPELSVDRNLRVMTPNIPLLVWIQFGFDFSCSMKWNEIFSAGKKKVSLISSHVESSWVKCIYLKWFVDSFRINFIFTTRNIAIISIILMYHIDFHTNRLYRLKRIRLVHFLGLACHLHWQWQGCCTGRSFNRLYRWRWMNCYLDTKTRWLTWRIRFIREIYGQTCRKWAYYLA